MDMSDIDVWLARGGAVRLGVLSIEAGFRELGEPGDGHSQDEATIERDKEDLLAACQRAGLEDTDALDQVLGRVWVPEFLKEYSKRYASATGRPPMRYPIDTAAMVVLVAMQANLNDMAAARLAEHVAFILTGMISSGRYR